jgi:hypothetical protein
MRYGNCFVVGMFAGSFSQMPFAEVVRLLSSSNQTGALVITDSDDQREVGRLFLQMGQLVDAIQGEHAGLDALQELCRWIEADFSFDTEASPPRQTLVAYPTEKLIEKITARTGELEKIRQATPHPDDIPVYRSGKDASSLNVTPDELAILLQCSGDKNVADVAEIIRKTPGEVGQSLARFRHAGIIELKGGPENDPSAPAAAKPKPEEKTDKPVRYWRGHKVQ